MFKDGTVNCIESNWTNKDGMDYEGFNRAPTPERPKYEGRVAGIQKRIQEAKEAKEAEEGPVDLDREWMCREWVVCTIQMICALGMIIFIVGFCITFTYYLIFKI